LARILLVRHAQIKLNNDDRFWSKTDLTLNDYGEWQAAKLRDRLAAETIDAVYTSTLSRARRTTEIIASGHDCMITACAEIDEVNFGFIEGLTYDEIKQLHPDLAGILSGFGTIIQFPGGESFKDLNERVKTFVERLAGHQPDETVLVVSHGGPLPLIICHLLAIGAEHWRKIWLELASLSIVHTYPEGARLSLLNDTSHLKTQE
jgi:alpha-ribazole phosphatase